MHGWYVSILIMKITLITYNSHYFKWYVLTESASPSVKIANYVVTVLN